MNTEERTRRGGENAAQMRLRFAKCRAAVSAEAAAARYGLQIDRRGRALCPFHDDHHPSMSFRNGRWHCWSCGAAGDSIDLTARLLGLTPAQALRRLDADFGLGLDPDRPPTPEERRQAREWEARAAYWRRFNVWREAQLMRLCDAIRAGNDAMKLTRELTDREATALRLNATLEYFADRLQDGTQGERKLMYERREEIEDLCRQVLDAAD